MAKIIKPSNKKEFEAVEKKLAKEALALRECRRLEALAQMETDEGKRIFEKWFSGEEITEEESGNDEAYEFIMETIHMGMG